MGLGIKVTTRRGSGFTFGSRRGQAAVEVGLMLPWLVIAFVGALDFGFGTYGLIATQNAARAGAEWGSATSSVASNITTNANTQIICNYAIAALEYAPNVGTSVTTCGGSSPISVSPTYNATGHGGIPTLTVSVTYTVNLLAVPGVSLSTLAITRTVEMPVRN
jgi:Flp pilus assembly protein TadG